MTTRFFASVNAFTSINSSGSAGLVSFPFAGLLMPVIQDMTKLFYIGKLVICTNNIIALIYTKRTLWIGRIPFAFLDNA